MRGSYEPKLDAYLDTPEKIRQCLSCQRPKCNNCRSSETRGRAVIGRSLDGRTVRFENISTAAAALKTSMSNICQAMRRGGRAKGMLWSYEE